MEVLMNYIAKYLLIVENQAGVQRDVPIFILPPAPTLPQVQALRVIVERGADPKMYELCAKSFDLLDMPNAAQAMRRRATHYAR
jgi:hypothetical protein